MILRKVTFLELPVVWEILQQAIEQRKQEGSEQWQYGYPNEQTVKDDIANSYGYVLSDKNVIIAYAAIIFGVEPAYNELNGRWLTNDDYAVVHRVAISDSVKGTGVATDLFKIIEDLVLSRKVYSIKVDTNFDNVRMLRILEKLGYTYCGEVIYQGGSRKAYEKVLDRS